MGPERLVLTRSFRIVCSLSALPEAFFVFPAGEKEKNMLQVNHLTLVHKKDLRTLVQDLSFICNEGDKVAVIGEEGNGKSTLLQWIYENDRIEDYCQWTGGVSGAGGAGYLAQQLSEEEKELSVYEFCMRSENFLELSYSELADISRQLSFPVDEYYSDRPVSTLSGGERIKLQLSRLLFDRPSVLLLDEPSSDIDLSTLRWLETFISGFPGVVVYISHDEVLMDRTATAVLHIEHPREGKPPRCTFSRVDYRTYVERRLAGISDQERRARKEKEEYEERMERYRRIQQSVEHAQNAVSRQAPSAGRLLKKKMHAVMSMGRRFEREAENMTKLPEVEEAVFLRFSPEILLPAGKTVLDLQLDKLWAGDRVLSHDLHLRVMGGEKIGIMGQNGAGKTTLLRLIAGELCDRRDIRAAYMPQDYADTLPQDKTPLEFLAPGGHKDDVTRASIFLGSIRFKREEMFHPISELSGGQKAKLFLTQMMLESSNVLILDEPTRNFSPLSQPQIRSVLRDYTGSILSVSHDRRFLWEVCDKVYCLSEAGLTLVNKDSLLD